MSDLISRKAAIATAISGMVRTIEGEKWIRIKEVKESLLSAPSAEPERKKGFWFTLKKGDKGYSAGDFKCSVCGEPNHTWLTKPKFCCNCGAEMSIFEDPIVIGLGIK